MEKEFSDHPSTLWDLGTWGAISPKEWSRTPSLRTLGTTTLSRTTHMPKYPAELEPKHPGNGVRGKILLSLPSAGGDVGYPSSDFFLLKYIFHILILYNEEKPQERRLGSINLYLDAPAAPGNLGGNWKNAVFSLLSY